MPGAIKRGYQQAAALYGVEWWTMQIAQDGRFGTLTEVRAMPFRWTHEIHVALELEGAVERWHASQHKGR